MYDRSEDQLPDDADVPQLQDTWTAEDFSEPEFWTLQDFADLLPAELD